MAYERVNWENLPSTKTPVNADNLNKLNDVIDAKVDSAISSIEIGGRNLIIGSANGGTDYAPGNGTLVDDGYLNNKAVSTNFAWSGYLIHMRDIANRNNLKNGDTVTTSIYVSTTSENAVTHDIYLYRQNGNGSDGGGDTMILKKGVWKRFKRTFSITDVTKLVNSMRFECSADTSGYNILWSSPKIELGNKATDWTPAPEDMNNTYSTNEVKIGTWTNGKPLYRKVISSTLPKVETDNVRVIKTVSIGANIKTGFIEKAFVYDTQANQILPIPFTLLGGQLIQTTMSLDGSLKLFSNSTYTNEQPVTIIVCYTKTTD